MKAGPVVFALAAVAAVLPVSIAASNAALLLLALALAWAAREGRGGRVIAAWRAEPALAALAAYVAAGLVSAALGLGFGESLRDNLKDAHRLWSLGLFVGALAFVSVEAAEPALAGGFALAALIGIARWTADLASGHLQRAHAFVHPVTFGEQMALGTLGAFCFLARGRDARARRAAAVLGALCAAAMILSETRAAMLAFVVGAAVAAALEPRLRRPAIGAFAVGALGAVFAEKIRYASAHFGMEFSAAAASTEQSTRPVLWRTAWRMFRDHPWTGVGPAHYRTEFAHYVPGGLYGQDVWSSAHNLYLHQLAERGLLGETVLLVLLGTLLVRAGRAARANSSAAALWAAAAVPAFLIMNLTEIAWQNEQFATLLLLIWALGTARRSAEIL